METTALLPRPLTMAHDRCLPVDPALTGLLADPGLVRGRVVGCTGSAATSLALALAARATRAGSWLAVVGVPALGLDAAREAGVALERVVAIDADHRRASVWAERVTAAADGFELVVTRAPRGSGAALRKVRQRLQARGVVLLAVGGCESADLVLHAEAGEWEGLGAGHGHLRRRLVRVQTSGRRHPRPLTGQVWLPGPDGAAAPTEALAEPLSEPFAEPLLEQTG